MWYKLKTFENERAQYFISFYIYFIYFISLKLKIKDNKTKIKEEAYELVPSLFRIF